MDGPKPLSPGACRGLANQFPRYDGAPSLYYPIIIRDVVPDPDVFGPTFVSARWGLIPGWIKEQRPGKPPSVNARCGGIATNGMFKKAYACRRCLIPIDGFFEWKDIFGTGKQAALCAAASSSPCQVRAEHAKREPSC